MSTAPRRKVPYTVPVQIVIVLFVTIAVMIVGGLVWSGHDAKPLIDFVLLIIPPTVGTILLGRKQEKIHDDTASIKQSVNGNLDAKLAELRAAIEALGNKTEGTENDSQLG